MILSKLPIRFASLVLTGLLLVTWGSPVESQPWDRYVKGYHGPYQGKVIDAETKQPLVGAAVVARWDQVKLHLFGTNTVFWEAREVLTDKNGEFVLNAEDIELNAPAQTLRPTFIIFYPGYGSYPRFHTTPQGFLGGIFEGKGTTVELPQLKTAKERLEKLISPYDLSDAPYKYTPNLMQLINAESVSLGLQPYPPKEKR